MTTLLKFNAVTPPATQPHDVIRSEQMVDDLLAALPLSCSTGLELFSVVTRAIGYGSADANLKAICARLQKHLQQQRS